MNVAAISIDHTRETLGLCQISAVLKANGHNVRLFVPYLSDNYIRDILEYSPSMIIASTLTETFPYYRQVLREVKSSCNAPIVVGGTHATVCPEIVLLPEIDFVCVGEGEHFIVKMAEYIAKGCGSIQDLVDIPNLAFKTAEGSFAINPLAPLVHNLDSLPFVDRDLFAEVAPAQRELTLMSSRGCPFACIFCFNKYYRSLYASDSGMKHNPVRFRSAESIISELEMLRSRYDTVYFLDDTIGLNKKLLMDMLAKYRERIGVPFKCNFRADQLDEDIVTALKISGCTLVHFGVESGNETIRNKVLKKNLPDEKIYRAAYLLNKASIPFNTTNIYGYIGDSIEILSETIDFNFRIKAHSAEYLLLRPFPKIEITNEISEKYGIPLQDFSIDPLAASISYYKSVPNMRKLIIKASIATTINRHDIKQMKPIINTLTKFGNHGYLMARKLIELFVVVKFFAIHPYAATKMAIRKMLDQEHNGACVTGKLNKYKMESVCNIPKVVWDEIVGSG